MEKHKVIILIIVTIIISFITIIFSYFGLFRYLYLHIQHSNGFIERYSTLPKCVKDRVVISFSITPNNIDKLKPMINSILDQTVKVDQIALFIPYEYEDNKDNIPQYIKDVANIFSCGKDYDKGTKLIPMLLREKECDTTIISLDNNIVYGKDFIYTMLEESKKNPNTTLIDKKGVAILVKPEHFGYDVINREKDNFDNTWFINKAKDSKVINYEKNYKILGF